MSDVFFIVLAIIAGFAAVIVLLKRWLVSLNPQQEQESLLKLITSWNQQTLNSLNQLRQEMQNRLDQNARAVTQQTNTINKQMITSNRDISQRLERAFQVIGGVQKHLGQLSEVSGYIKDLHDTLQAPKLRGNIGEQILTDLIKQHIPQNKFTLQHAFRDGTIVDAAIQTAEGIIPVDSKFPMDAFRRYQQARSPAERETASKEFVNAVRKHIRDITSKYIKPDEGTIDFAVMYIPSEPIAYEILVNFPDLTEYARDNRVTVTSPNQFNALLRVILIGMERQQVNQQIKYVLQTLKTIQKEAGKFEEALMLVNRHVGYAKNASDKAIIDFTRLKGKIDNYQLDNSEQQSLPENPQI